MNYCKLLLYIVVTVILVSAFQVTYAQIHIPNVEFQSSSERELANKINKCFRIASGDIVGNFIMFKGGILDEDKLCVAAGLDYDKPWTRDASINVWNGVAVMSPDVAKNTLLAQTDIVNGRQVIVGQQWDNIIWSIGAWHYFLVTGDQEFLKISYDVIKNTMMIREDEEFNPELGLFRGPAVYGDGVAAYPSRYTVSGIEGKSGSYSGIDSWTENNPDKKFPVGYGVPMYVLSTNSVYYKAYRILSEMSALLNIDEDIWLSKAERIKKSINDNLWNGEKGSYNYFLDDYGVCTRQEGMGEAFVILFGIADSVRSRSVFESIHVEDRGIPCVYPTFERYTKCGEDNYGRHSGTVWPHIQGFWADACLKNNMTDLFLHEFVNLTNNSFRDNQFVEIYHPVSGESYGGLQEASLDECGLWASCNRQTWSATAYIRMVLTSIIGLNFTLDGLLINPSIPFKSDSITVSNLRYRNAKLNISIRGSGSKIASCSINGTTVVKPLIDKNMMGECIIEIKMEE